MLSWPLRMFFHVLSTIKPCCADSLSVGIQHSTPTWSPLSPLSSYIAVTQLFHVSLQNISLFPLRRKKCLSFLRGKVLCDLISSSQLPIFSILVCPSVAGPATAFEHSRSLHFSDLTLECSLLPLVHCANVIASKSASHQPLPSLCALPFLASVWLRLICCLVQTCLLFCISLLLPSQVIAETQDAPGKHLHIIIIIFLIIRNQ